MKGCTQSALVDQHFAGTIAPDRERAMREHLGTCPSCRDLYRRRLLLARLDPQALPSEERIARGLGLRSGRGAGVVRLGIVIAAAAAIALLVRAHPGMDGFTARGGGSPTPGGPASRVFVYDVRDGMAPALAESTVRTGDELAFSYENGGARRRLLVFGVDEHQHVYWFHPAWTSNEDDPVAIPIEQDAERHELPEAIRQHLDGGRLQIRSVFVDDPLSVRQIEALLRQSPSGPLPIPGAIETSLVLVVTQ
jgi:hypothetical protein